jgi:CPA1 family monovalent cation:H+ antiporter
MIFAVKISLALLFVVAAVAVAARRLKLPPAILLVLVGVALALLPGLPRVELVPELVLLVVLPPLIYSAGVAMSWREFRFNLRPIGLLAIGCVAFTTVAVAAVAHWLLAFPWPVAFVLGAIVSPPDVVAPLAIARRLKLPRRLLVILEGEGLANDATALILYRFAIAAVSAGAFSFTRAAGTFALIVIGEIAWGIALGWATLHLRRWVKDPRVEIVLALLTPYAAFWVPEELGGSGVLATVAAGLYISWNGPVMIPSATRLQGIFFWDLFIYVVEGLVFLLTGLQARTLADRIGDIPWRQLVFAALVTSAVVIVARFVWVFPATYLPRWLSPSLARRDPSPPWQWPFALAFTGVRGIVSLAAALAIPFATASGQPFPERDLILFLTYSVILVTLVGQGLLFPWVMCRLGLHKAGAAEQAREEETEMAARRDAVGAVLRKLEEFAAEKSLPEEVIKPLRARHQGRLRQIDHRMDDSDAHTRLAECWDELEIMLIEAERAYVYDLLRQGRLHDEARRRIERELDLREAHLRGAGAEATNIGA